MKNAITSLQAENLKAWTALGNKYDDAKKSVDLQAQRSILETQLASSEGDAQLAIQKQLDQVNEQIGSGPASSEKQMWELRGLLLTHRAVEDSIASYLKDHPEPEDN